MPEGKLRCAICQHVDRAKIEGQFQAGTSLRRIAEAFPGTSAWSVRRHCAKHMQRPQTTMAPAAAAGTGAPTLEQAILETLAESVVGQDFVRRPQMMRLARSIVAQAIAGRSSALHLLFGKLWPDAPRPVIGELVVNTAVGINATTGEGGKPLTQNERNAQLVERMRALYNLGPRFSRDPVTKEPVN
jgi:hypothetical protein